MQYYFLTKPTDPACLNAPWVRNPSEETKEIIDQRSVIAYFTKLTSRRRIPNSIQKKVTSSRFSAVQLSSQTFANPTVFTRVRQSSHILQFESDTIDPHAPFTNDLDRTMTLSWQLDSFTISPRVSVDSRSTMIERFWIGFDHNMRL